VVPLEASPWRLKVLCLLTCLIFSLYGEIGGGVLVDGRSYRILEILGNMLVLTGHEGCLVVERNCFHRSEMVSFHSASRISENSERVDPGHMYVVVPIAEIKFSLSTSHIFITKSREYRRINHSFPWALLYISIIWYLGMYV